MRDASSSEGRPVWMCRMGIPLTGLADHVLAALDSLGPTFSGWGIREYPVATPFFVDVGEHRYRGATLEQAIVNARARVGEDLAEREEVDRAA